MIRKMVIGALLALVMVTSSLPALAGVAGTPQEKMDEAGIQGLATELEKVLAPAYEASLAAKTMPDEVQFMPPLTKAHGVNRAKNVLAETITPLALAAAMQAQTSGTTDVPVHEIDALALNVFAYYATVGYEEDPEFGALAQERLKQAVAMYVAADGDVDKLFPEARTEPPTQEEVQAFVESLMNVQMDGVEVATPKGQELGRDITILESDFLKTVDALFDHYRKTQTVNVDVLDARWSNSYSWFYYYGWYYGGYYFSGDWLVYRYYNLYRGYDSYQLYDLYRVTYDNQLSVSEFERMLSQSTQHEIFNRIEQVRGLVSVPFVASASNGAGNPEANLVGTVALPFAFADSWWMEVLKFDHDETVYQHMQYARNYGGYVDYFHYYAYRYYQIQDWYHYVYHRHWYYTCSWWSCYWTYWWHYHGSYYAGRTTHTFYSGSGSYRSSYSWNYHYGWDHSNRQSTSVHSALILNERQTVDMPGIVVAPEGKITFSVPAKQYNLLARESTARDAVESRTGVDTGASTVPFEGIGALPTQIETTRYDEQCASTFVIAPTPNDCDLLADEDNTAQHADGSEGEATAEATLVGAEATLAGAEATVGDAAADPEGFVNGAVPAVPEPTVPEPQVPEVPEPQVPEAPDAEALLAETLAALQGGAEGAIADAEAIAADPEGFVADTVDAARAVTVETPAQDVATVTADDDETIEVTFKVAEFTSGAVYVASIGLVAKDGLTAVDPEDVLVTVTGRGVAGESPTLEYSEDTPCYDSQLTGDGGSQYFPEVPDTTPEDCVRDSGDGESAVFRIVHALDLDGEDAFTGVDATSTNVGATVDAGEAAATGAGEDAGEAVDDATADVPEVDPENPPEPPGEDDLPAPPA